MLLERGAVVNAQAKDRSTPLHRASRFGAVEVARILLEHGADVEAEDDKGRTPLRSAGRDDMRKLLLEYSTK